MRLSRHDCMYWVTPSLQLGKVTTTAQKAQTFRWRVSGGISLLHGLQQVEQLRQKHQHVLLQVLPSVQQVLVGEVEAFQHQVALAECPNQAQVVQGVCYSHAVFQAHIWKWEPSTCEKKVSCMGSTKDLSALTTGSPVMVCFITNSLVNVPYQDQLNTKVKSGQCALPRST